MRRNHLGPEGERHRPGAESGLKHHKPSRKGWQFDRSLLTPAHPRSGSDTEDHQAQGSGCIAVDHLRPALGGIDGRVGEAGFREPDLILPRGNRQESVTARPVRASQSGIHEPGPGAKHDHHNSQQTAGKRRDLKAPMATLKKTGAGTHVHDRLVLHINPVVKNPEDAPHRPEGPYRCVGCHTEEQGCPWGQPQRRYRPCHWRVPYWKRDCRHPAR